MLMELDFSSEVPIYRQIYKSIIGAIAGGQLAPGENLPTVRRLAEEIGVNMHTVNKAYSYLKEEGYIEMNRRRGAVVCEPSHGSSDLERITLELEGAAAQAKSKQVDRAHFLRLCAMAYDNFEGGSDNETK